MNNATPAVTPEQVEAHRKAHNHMVRALKQLEKLEKTLPASYLNSLHGMTVSYRLTGVMYENDDLMNGLIRGDIK